MAPIWKTLLAVIGGSKDVCGILPFGCVLTLLAWFWLKRCCCSVWVDIPSPLLVSCLVGCCIQHLGLLICWTSYSPVLFHCSEALNPIKIQMQGTSKVFTGRNLFHLLLLPLCLSLQFSCDFMTTLQLTSIIHVSVCCCETDGLLILSTSFL